VEGETPAAGWPYRIKIPPGYEAWEPYFEKNYQDACAALGIEPEPKQNTML